MARRKILILGDSHTGALAKACEARAARHAERYEVEFDINWLLTKKGDKIRGDLEMADARERAAALQRDDIVVISIAGTLHNVFGLLQHEKAFDIFTPGDENMTLAEGFSVVPANALWDMFNGVVERNRKITTLRGAARCPVYHLATPPPKQDSQFIMARAARYRERVVADAGINPAATRLKLWKLEMRVLADLFAEWTIRFLHPPEGAITPEGFLKPEYYADDATHANAAYGELVLQQLERTTLEGSWDTKTV